MLLHGVQEALQLLFLCHFLLSAHCQQPIKQIFLLHSENSIKFLNQSYEILYFYKTSATFIFLCQVYINVTYGVILINIKISLQSVYTLLTLYQKMSKQNQYRSQLSYLTSILITLYSSFQVHSVYTKNKAHCLINNQCYKIMM